MRVHVEGVGLVGPGLRGWAQSRAALAGAEPYRPAPIVVAPAELLPAAERRRVGQTVKIALGAGHEAFANAGRDAAATATVFASSGGDSDNVHHVCEALAAPQPEVSPTRFHNSVHNAASGYWSIAVRSHENSTSLCCHDASFAAGLLEASSQVVADGGPIGLIVYDQPYPEPLSAVRPLAASFGAALVLAPQATARTFATLEVGFVPREAQATRMAGAELEALRSGVPAARSLPLLAALARGARETVILGYVAGTHLRVETAPCA